MKQNSTANLVCPKAIHNTTETLKKLQPQTKHCKRVQKHSLYTESAIIFPKSMTKTHKTW